MSANVSTGQSQGRGRAVWHRAVAGGEVGQYERRAFVSGEVGQYERRASRQRAIAPSQRRAALSDQVARGRASRCAVRPKVIAR